MTFELHAKTDPGRKFVAAADDLRAHLRANADKADRDAKMPNASYEALQDSGIAAAFIPEELGGWGLTSIHDWMLGIRSLAQGDGSTAIAINMHLAISRGMATAFRMNGSKQDSGAAIPLRAIADKKMLVCATATERGTDNLHPLTEATPCDDGWEINGTKLFVTMSPIATHLGMNLRMRDDEGDHLVTTMMPIDTPGLIQQNDWDALGMRGSGSQSVKFENAKVGKSAIRKLGPWGQWSTNVLVNRTLGNLTLVSAFLGIAEHARELALGALKTQKRNGESVVNNPGVQQTAGEMEILLTQSRSTLPRQGLGLMTGLRMPSLTHPPSKKRMH